MKQLLTLLIVPLLVMGQESRLGTYRIEMTVAGGAQRLGESNAVTIAVVDKSGSRLFELQKTVPFDIPFPSVGIFERGSLMVVHPFDGLIELYNRHGAPVRAFKPLKDAQPEYERSMKFAVHDSIAALLISEPGLPNTSLVLINDLGDVLLEKSIESTHAQGIAFSSDASLIAAGTYRWENGALREETHFIARTGNAVSSAAGGFARGSFSDDGKRFLGFTNRTASLTDIASASRLWHRTAASSQMILDAAWRDDDAIVLTSDAPSLIDKEWHYKYPRLTIVGAKGIVIGEQAIPSMSFKSARLRKFGNEVMMEIDGVVYPK